MSEIRSFSATVGCSQLSSARLRLVDSESLTPQHMAARRGHVFLAEVLLNAGAEIERRDSKGETPLRRAVNCGQGGMVEFLLGRGADSQAADNRGQTPSAAARQEGIRQALRRAD